MNNPKRKTSLWTLIFSPLVWIIYMTACYIMVAIWCAKTGREGTLEPLRIPFGIMTGVALVLIGIQILRGFNLHRSGEDEGQLPHDDATPEDRERFLGFANFLISSLSAIALLFIAFNGFIFRSCH